MSACAMNGQKFIYTDFKTLTLPSSPNYCLVCPNCHGKRKIKAPVYAISANKLKEHWKTMLAQQPRVRLLKSDHYQMQYVQRSAVFRFPDIIDIEFLPIDASSSTINIFSRSLYGYSDFGVNCRRLHRWLAS